MLHLQLLLAEEAAGADGDPLLARVPCCSAVEPFHSATALQRGTGQTQRYSAERAVQRYSAERAVYSATARNRQSTVLQHPAGTLHHSATARNGQYSATARNEQSQRYSATALQRHSATARNSACAVYAGPFAARAAPAPRACRTPQQPEGQHTQQRHAPRAVRPTAC